MSGSIAYQPYAQGNAAGGFNITSDGLVQGLSYDDPIHRYDMINGVLASTETLPMWGGVGIFENLPGAGAGISAPNAALGPTVGRATSLTAYTAGKLAAFSVLDLNYAAVSTPQSPVPLTAVYGQVNYYRLGSGKRVAVQISSGLAATLAGGMSDAEVAWDFTNQQLIAYTSGTPLPVSIREINLGNSMVVSYASGAATWNRSGNAAIILL